MFRRVLKISVAVLLLSESAFAQEPVAQFQELLAQRGCDVGVVDGQWGRRTGQAAALLGESAGIEVERPVTMELIAQLQASDARCPAPPVFKVTEPAGPQAYWTAWEQATNCESDSAYRLSPIEANDKVTLPTSLPDEFGWNLGMPDGLGLTCDRVNASLSGVLPANARENDLDYGDDFPADIYAQSLSRYLTNVFAAGEESARQTARSTVVDFLVRAAQSKGLTQNNIVPSRGGPNLAYPSANFFQAALIAFIAVQQDMSQSDRKAVYDWLRPMIERVINNRYGDALDNKNAYREVIASTWGYVVGDQRLIQRGQELYRFHIRYMRPDGTFGLDATRGGSSAQYTSIHMGDLIMIAALDAMAGGNLFDHEVDGRSIHDAVRFYLDFKEDPVEVNGRYARDCDASMGTLDRPSDSPWRLNVMRGGEGFTAMRLYALFNADHENTLRFEKLLPDLASSRAVWDSHQGPLMCFLGAQASLDSTFALAKTDAAPESPALVPVTYVVSAQETETMTPGATPEVDSVIFAEAFEAGLPNDQVRFIVQGFYDYGNDRFGRLEIVLEEGISIEEGQAALKCLARLDDWGDGDRHLKVQFSRIDTHYSLPNVDCLVEGLPADRAAELRVLVDHFADIAVGMVESGAVAVVGNDGMRSFMEQVARGELTIGR